MTRNNPAAGKNRRTFMKEISILGGTAMFAGYATNFGESAALAGQAAPSTDWSKQMGLELYTVRDLMTDQKSYIGTLEKVAEIGYKEIEPAGGYAGLEPKDFRALLDRLGLRMPSTHSGASGTGADLDKQLEGFQTMGIQYTEISAGGRGGAGRGPGGGGGGVLAPGAYYNAGNGITYNSFTQSTAFGPYQPPATLESVKQRAAQLNANGKILQKFGMKTFVHNHTGEFEKLSDNDQTTYDVLLAETDPALVAMQLDIGWAYVAGVDVFEMFKKSPGRFELWHIKDMVGLKTVNPALSPNARTSSMAFVPVGAGQLDFKPVFAQAKLAGLKHFAVEQDDGASWGDSLAAARVSYQGLSKMLTS
jgi:sugar phosphate isomerase/epimerase